MSARHPRTALLVSLALAACGGSDGMDPEPDDSATRPASIRLSISADTLTWIGDGVTLQGTALNASGLELPDPVSWTSSAPAVATVDAGGTVTAVANGTAAITASAGTASAVALVVVRQEATALEKLSGDAQTAAAGDALAEPLVVRADDQGGTPVAGAVVTWQAGAGSGSAAPSLVSTDAGGLAATTWTLGDAQEAQTLQATLPAGVAATFAATAVLPEPGSLAVTSVQPTVLVEGQSATITGTGFSATAGQNTVTIDGVAATVTAASPTGLTIAVPVFDCRPPRDVTLTVQRGGDQASAATSVTPVALLSMAVGEGYYATSSQARCLHLAAGGLNREYLIGALSVSEVASSVVAAQLFSASGSGVVLEAVADGAVSGVLAPGRWAMPGVPRAPSGRASAPAAVDAAAFSARDAWWREGEAAVRDSERALLERVGGVAAARAAVVGARGATQAAARDAAAGPSVSGGPRGVFGGPQGVSGGPQGISGLPVPAEGDTLTLFGGYGCSGRPTVRAVARLVGAKTVWLDDVANPGPALSASELQELAAVYENAIDATLTDYFGADGDVDANGRVFVLMTKTVNEEENLAGFVWSGDLFPTTSCLQSNHAEIFYGYVPDPDGTVGTARSKTAVLQAYPSLIAHEVAHVRQMAQVFFGNASSKSTWESEGGATLAEQLVGYRVVGHGPRQNLGYTDWQAGGAWYSDWVNDLARYQGFVGTNTRTEGAPEQCTWIARVEEGNSGPCAGSQRAPYGVPSTLLRYVLDVWGPGHAGGEQGMMRQITGSTQRGFANLALVTGEPIESVLAGFMSMLWTDGQGFDPMASWDVWDIFGSVNANARLKPYESTLVEPSMSVDVRGGSSAFLRWQPLTAHGPTSLRLRTPSGGVLPLTMTLWIVRLR